MSPKVDPFDLDVKVDMHAAPAPSYTNVTQFSCACPSVHMACNTTPTPANGHLG